MKPTSDPPRARIALLDEIRGLCVVLMVAHHTFYTLGYLFGLAICRRWFEDCLVLQPLFSGTFFVLCGVCSTLSRNNWKRGGLLAAAAGAVSFVMWLFLPQEPIWFGVLHMLASCILLYALCHRAVARIPAAVGLVLCAAGLLLTWHVKEGYFGLPHVWTADIPQALLEQGWLYPTGLGRIPGIQSDYYPLLPWMFLFFAGAFSGRYLPRLPQALRRPHLPPLAFVGRHALVIYLVHQPVIFGISYLIFWILGKL